MDYAAARAKDAAMHQNKFTGKILKQQDSRAAPAAFKLWRTIPRR
jgi:hypothetical protein